MEVFPLSHKVEILSVGTELLLGSIANTDAQMLSQGLSALGLNVYWHTVVGDNPQRLRQALDIAEEKELDLVKIAPTAKPPVCKLMDYGKYRFEQSKREKEARKNQKVISVKEVRLSPTIEEHDMQVRVRDCVKFLQNGDRVKVSIRFRGRMITHSDVGLQVMNEFFARVKDYAVQDRKPSTEGRTMTMMLSPKQDK